MPNERIKRKCRFVQINAIKEKVDTLNDKAVAYYTLGDLYRQNQSFTDAEIYYLKAIKLEPDHAPLHNDMAVTFHLQGKLQQAIEHYNKALQIDTDSPGTKDNLNKALAQQRNRPLKGKK